MVYSYCNMERFKYIYTYCNTYKVTKGIGSKTIKKKKLRSKMEIREEVFNINKDKKNITYNLSHYESKNR